jgi:hypothetical protein
MRVLPSGASLLLVVTLGGIEVVASASGVPHSPSFYFDFLSWSCEQAEMQLSKQADSLFHPGSTSPVHSWQ